METGIVSETKYGKTRSAEFGANIVVDTLKFQKYDLGQIQVSNHHLI